MKAAKFLLAIPIWALALPLTSNAEPMNKPHCNTLLPMPFEGEESPDGIPAMQGLLPHLAELNLSETQQDKILLLLRAQTPQIQVHYEEQRFKLINEMRKLSSAESFDEVKVKLVADMLASLEKEIIFNHARIGNQIFMILTPEQRKQLLEKESPKLGNFHETHRRIA
jgi:Spy/CpxP family protein refolding chaperone